MKNFFVCCLILFSVGSAYTITFEENFNSAVPPEIYIIRRVVVDKKSGATYFDHYIGSTKEEIMALGDESFGYSIRRENAWRYFCHEYYIDFYFDNDIVNKIEFGDN